MMKTYALCLIAATASAVSLSRRARRGAIDETCWYYGTPYGAEEYVQTYVIDADETVLAQDILDTGAFHGYIHLGDPYWDLLNDEDNECDYPAFHMDCDTDNYISPNAFTVDRWGLLAIYPTEMEFMDG